MMKLATALIAIVVFGLRAMASDGGSDPSLFARQLRAEGWVIPGLETAGKPIESSEKPALGERVSIHKLELAGETLVDLELYACEGEGNVRIRRYRCSVMDIYRYEASGRVFAYLVKFVPVVSRADGGRTYNAGVFRIHYIDEDGDGKFEARSGELAKAPRWVATK